MKQRSSLSLLLSCAALALVSCTRARASTIDQKPRAAPQASVPAPSPPAPPLAHAGELVPLSVAGYLDGVLAVPEGPADHPRPVLVALHGTGDKPSWQCGEMSRLVENRAFVVCPAGNVIAEYSTPGDTRYAFGRPADTLKEVDAALAVLHAEYGDAVDDGPMILEGFSWGATSIVTTVAKEAKRFPRVILTEGGNGWWPGVADEFVKNGGQRVLFACGQAGCDASAKVAAKMIEHAGGGARTVYGPHEGHSYGGKVAAGIREDLAWLVEGDPRWDAGGVETSADGR